MNQKPKLTTRQQEIFELIERVLIQTGAPPTRAEIASAMQFRSVNAAEEHLRALARKGVIELVGGTSRGIRIKQNVGGYTPALPGLEQLCLPLIGRVAAGSPILAQASIEGTYSVEPGMFTKRPDFLLRVRGLSMRDAGILDGDLLAVAKTKTASDGQIVVARLDDEVTVKRFKQTAHGIQLLAENPDYSPILINAKQIDFEIEGLVVGLIRGSF